MAAQSCEGTVLITAAADRIGRAIAHRLAPCWTIVLQESREFLPEAEELARRLRAAGARAAVIATDLEDVEATGRLVERAAAAAGPVTLLVNAATQFGADRGSFDALAWTSHFAVNLRAPCQLADAFAAALPPGSGGAIVNLVDRRLWQNAPAARTYELSQAALWSATETLARAYAPAVRVNAVGPAKAIAAHGAAGSRRRGMPLAGAAAALTIAKAVAYLATAANITGQMIAVDPEENFAAAGAS
jgi:NAD(P)-dependent dehydrogenase (short-subunit alcohol dehydrogenase family)